MSAATHTHTHTPPHTGGKGAMWCHTFREHCLSLSQEYSPSIANDCVKHLYILQSEKSYPWLQQIRGHSALSLLETHSTVRQKKSHPIMNMLRTGIRRQALKEKSMGPPREELKDTCKYNCVTAQSWFQSHSCLESRAVLALPHHPSTQSCWPSHSRYSVLFVLQRSDKTKAAGIISPDRLSRGLWIPTGISIIRIKSSIHHNKLMRRQWAGQSATSCLTAGGNPACQPFHQVAKWSVPDSPHPCLFLYWSL